MRQLILVEFGSVNSFSYDNRIMFFSRLMLMEFIVTFVILELSIFKPITVPVVSRVTVLELAKSVNHPISLLPKFRWFHYSTRIMDLL